MKRRRSNTSPPKTASGEKICKSEVQRLIQQEVHSARKQKETKLELLLDERIQQIQHELSYGPSIHKLKADINKFKLSAEAALAYTKKMGINRTEDNTQKKTAVQPRTPTAPPVVAENESKKPINHSKITTKHTGEQPYILIDLEAIENQEEQKARVEVDHHPGDSSPKQIQKDAYPPLPVNHLPSKLSIQAASYNLPGKVTVTIGQIRKPCAITLRWDMDVCPSAPPMDSYSVFITVENPKGSGVFRDWRKLSEERPKPSRTVYALITKYKPGYKISVTVVGKDKFGRYGPYSNIVSLVPTGPPPS